ncbi:hypothetical protein [Streptomyces sp. NPDC001530]
MVRPSNSKARVPVDGPLPRSGPTASYLQEYDITKNGPTYMVHLFGADS